MKRSKKEENDLAKAQQGRGLNLARFDASSLLQIYPCESVILVCCMLCAFSEVLVVCCSRPSWFLCPHVSVHLSLSSSFSSSLSRSRAPLFLPPLTRFLPPSLSRQLHMRVACDQALLRRSPSLSRPGVYEAGTSTAWWTHFAL